MTTATMTRGYQSVFAAPRNTGASQIAANLSHFVREAARDLMQPVTWQLRRDRAIESLLEAYNRCSVQGWDGYDSLPLSDIAVTEACNFLEALPSWIPIPDVVPEPDGSVGLEWYAGKNRVFVVSVSGNNVVYYAGLIGKGNKKHGSIAFNESIPKDIIEGINEVLS